MRRVYLDHNATTPLAPEVLRAMTPYLTEEFGNASSIHSVGQRARAGVEQARRQVGALLGAREKEIVFTSGGTEADNLAVKGAVWAARGRRPGVPHLVTTAVEHPAVLAPARWLADRGDCHLDVVPPRPDGTVDVEGQLLRELQEETGLGSDTVSSVNWIGLFRDIACGVWDLSYEIVADTLPVRSHEHSQLRLLNAAELAEFADREGPLIPTSRGILEVKGFVGLH
jgi:cysteine desulfurase